MMCDADPEEVGLAAVQELEWPEHVEVGTLPEGAQWRFADPQDPAAVQVALAAATNIFHLRLICCPIEVQT